MVNNRFEREMLRKYMLLEKRRGFWEIEVSVPGKYQRQVLEDTNSTMGPFLFRIDAVFTLYDRSSVEIIEIKRKLTPGVLGQLLVYREAFCRWKGYLTKEVKLIALCESAEIELIEILKKFGVEVKTI